jgi:hypothetical protein
VCERQVQLVAIGFVQSFALVEEHSYFTCQNPANFKTLCKTF